MRVGLTAQLTHTVTEADTAAALGSGTVPVLGTPKVLALLEAATVAALDGALEPGQTSVGTAVRLRHVAATPVGRPVRAEATLASVDGSRLTFQVALRDADGRAELAVGELDRAVVDRDRFVARSLGR